MELDPANGSFGSGMSRVNLDQVIINIRDLFNLFGCLLKPATLPTQIFMAVLYVVATLILTLQSVYYGYCYTNGEPVQSQNEAVVPTQNGEPVQSQNEAVGQYSEDVMDPVEEPLLGGSLPSKAAHPSRTQHLCCVVSAVTFILGTMLILVFELSKARVPGYESRKLLQVNQMINSDAGGHATIGTYLGWAMAVIYMGGRLPQICLNIRRGHVDGLNPFMFIFALLGNTTYAASILVNSLDWLKIMPNMPWLVDAGGCALLDIFILLQFIYFGYQQSQHISRVGQEGVRNPTLSN